ncbi:MAG: Rpn family recombination-promoting nuclease/putative transposase [Planctomycetes bacterium]|nr:Rpn family recombination-promoting nuclease/putative transposase [Planctomycetota bacterium]
MANSPHDALFRYTFGQPEHAAPLLRSLLPRELTAAFDWSTLTPLSGTRIDRNLGRRQTDLLCSVESTSGTVYVHVLIEHSSRVSRWMAFRMLDYSVGIWRDLLRRQPRLERLPRIIPVVLHHGREDWWADTEFADLLEVAGGMGWRQPRFSYVVRSLHGMQPRELEGLALSLLGTLTLAALQYVPNATLAEMRATFGRWGGLMRRLLLAPSGEEEMMALSEYVLTTTRVAPDVLIEVVENEVNRRASKIMETTATRLRREGRAEERAALLLRQLTARFGPLTPEVEVRIRCASAEESGRWALRLLDAARLEDVFAPRVGDS